MLILDRSTMKEILRVTCSILKNNFCYSEQVLSEFLDEFSKEAALELTRFQHLADDEVINELQTDRMARVYFTCYFTSTFLRETFINKMHFTDKELAAFESIIPKCLKPQEKSI